MPCLICLLLLLFAGHPVTQSNFVTFSSLLLTVVNGLNHLSQYGWYRQAGGCARHSQKSCLCCV